MLRLSLLQSDEILCPEIIFPYGQRVSESVLSAAVRVTLSNAVYVCEGCAIGRLALHEIYDDDTCLASPLEVRWRGRERD